MREATGIEKGNESLPQAKKKLVRRVEQDRSQHWRHGVQWAFVALNIWIGAEFFLWVRSCEGDAVMRTRPAGVDGWLPIAGLMNTRYWIASGHVPAIHPAAMYLFIGFLLISFLVKKAFCSWLCPVGTLSENLWKLGRKIFKRNFELPRWLDLGLRSLKYILMAFFLVIVGGMSAEAIESFIASPFGILADVQMLNFFSYVNLTAAVIVGVLFVASIFVQNFWCRYLCPYGALMGIASLLTPLKIRRDEGACIDCAKCTKACPSLLKVDKLMQVRSAECTGCMQCIAVCPAQDALQLALPAAKAESAAKRWRRRRVSPALAAALIAYIFFGVVLVAHATNHWQTQLPESIYRNLVSHAREIIHPEQ